MTDHDVLPEVLVRFLDHPVAPPPLADIRSKGATARRRRRRAVMASGAAVLVIAGSAFAGQALFGDEPREPVADPHVEQLAVAEPPLGTRWAGIGRVVLAVPKGWADGAVRCNQPHRDTVYFTDSTTTLCRPAFRGVSSLAISDHAFETKAISPGPVDGNVGGHDVRMIHGCFKASDGPCFANVSVPDLGAFFQVTIHGGEAEQRVQEMRDSLTVLPADQTTVPYLGPGPWQPRDVDRLVADLQSAGFEPVVETLDCDMGLCIVGAWIEPRASHVLPIGGTVTIKVMPGFGKVDLGGLECPGGRVSTRFFNVRPPATAHEAREQDWATTARRAALQTIPQLSGLPNPTLDPAVPLGRGVVQFTVRDFSRTVISVVTVRELIPDAWAITEISTCTD